MSIKNNYHLGNYYNQILKVSPLHYTYQYILEFVEGGTYYDSGQWKKFTLFDHDDTDPANNFSYWVAGSVSIPSFDISVANTAFYGTQFRIPGAYSNQQQHSLNTQIWLDQDFTMYDKLQEWRDQISRLQLSGGGLKVIPTIKLRAKLLDASHKYFTTSFVYEGCWLKSLGSANLNYGQGGTVLRVNANFTCQYCYRDDDCDLSMDPLCAARVAAAYGED